MFVVISAADPLFAPLRLENRCLIDHVWFRQRGMDSWQHLAPAEALPFAWDLPSAKRKLLSLQFGSRVSDRLYRDDLSIQHIDIEVSASFNE